MNRRIANWFLKKLLISNFHEEFFGDLDEMYDERLKNKGKIKAEIFYWVDTFHLIFGFNSLRPSKTNISFITLMNNSAKMTWRTAIRQKWVTAINIVGLTIGIFFSILIGLYVYNESNFDTFHSKADRIFRVNQPDIWGDWTTLSSMTGPNVSKALLEEIDDFEEVTRIGAFGTQLISNAQPISPKSFNEDHFYLADPNFLRVFDFNLVSGNKDIALQEPYSAIITSKTAKRYFGNTDALGKVFEVRSWDGKWEPFTVTGVIDKIPDNSSIQFDFLVSISSYQEWMNYHDWKWIGTAFSTYVLTNPEADIQRIEAKLQEIPPKWATPTAERIFNQTYEEFTQGNPWILNLQPLKDIYLSDSVLYNEFGPSGNLLNVRIFIITGILILILSSINYINLYMSKTSSRLKEVGLKKVLGTNITSLRSQFIIESIIFILISTVLAVLIVLSAETIFNIYIPTLNFEPLNSPFFYLVLGIFILFIGLISGIYPAISISRITAVKALKSHSGIINGGSNFRNVLITFQFSISLILIISAVFINKQINFASSIDLGYEKNNVIQIHNIEKLGFNTEALKSELEGYSSFDKVGKSFGIPGRIFSGDKYSRVGSDKVVYLENLRTEGDYIDLLNLEFVQGRNFVNNSEQDKYSVLINEKAASILGWDLENESIIGNKIKISSGNEDQLEVIGVVKNFNFNDTKQEIKPLIIIHFENDKTWDYGAGLSYYSIKLNENSGSSGRIKEDLAFIETALHKIDPSIPFEYSFIEEQMSRAFANERELSKVMKVFTFAAIVIACLGLIGLSIYQTERRMKEFSIRKVMGANSLSLIFSYSGEIIKLIIVSACISMPIAWFLVDFWLQEFPYKTAISANVFIGSGISTMIIALLVISYQMATVLKANPTETLKME